MKVTDLPQLLPSLVVTPTDSEEEVIAHYMERGYERINYHGRPTFLFTNERNFGDRRHLISLHGPGPAVPEHIYQYPILKYCYQGTWEVMVDGTPVVLQPGECLLTDRNVPQAIPRTAPGMMGVNVILNEEYFATHMLAAMRGGVSALERELTNIGASHDQWRHFPTADDERVRTLIDLILMEMIEPSPRAADVTDGLAEALYTYLMGTFEQAPTEADTTQSNLMGSIRDYIAKNFREGNMARMAADLGYQRSYLSRVIKQSTGTTFKQLVNAERMKRATVLLQAGEMPVYTVAEEVGIPNLASFYRRFREWSGCTPQEWRERART